MSAKEKNSFVSPEAAARDVVKHYFGRAPRKLEEMGGGRTNHVYEAVTSEGPIIIRLSDDSQKLPCFMKEQWAVTRAAEAGVPVPEILETGQGVVPYAYMIQRKAAGIMALKHTGSTTHVLRQMGELAARIHGIKTTGFGPVFDWSDNKLSKNSTWKACLNDELDVAHRLSVLRQHSGLSVTAMRKVAAAARRLGDWKGKPSLAHGDLRLKNVMVDEQDTITAVLDWEECYSAPALLWDLSIALHDLGLDGKQAFLEGYGIAPKKYAELAPLIKVFNMLHYAPVLEHVVALKDRERLQFYQLRLSGGLDLFSV